MWFWNHARSFSVFPFPPPSSSPFPSFLDFSSFPSLLLGRDHFFLYLSWMTFSVFFFLDWNESDVVRPRELEGRPPCGSKAQFRSSKVGKWASKILE
ncbi:hypothetical protein IE53DRAFT_90940 [Violaceomyces palustris]|uniref:Uncharacterized protein n=1 Tax=Violaceomyces palustris TaxID=1673888 RepID=A0ACD0P795_9BASI|nr:hypothetical protein IE53DRAFT_90940 [Violaceomyces palustris]